MSIGPTFAAELAAAGLAGTPCAWSPDGTYSIDQLTDVQKQTFLQVLAAHNSAAALPVTKDQVAAERDRRLALGFNYTFSDARGTQRFGTSASDMKGWDEVSKLASAFIATGTPTAPMNLVTDTANITVTAQEWQMVLLAAAQFRQPIWWASFNLEATTPIPADYAADTHWPPIQ